MTARAVTAIVSDWLAAEGLVDEAVPVGDVRFHDSGLLSAYLRLVKKRAITFGRHVWFREPALADQAVQANWPLFAHELVHVGQYRERGFARFLAAYLWHFAKAGFRYSRKLPLEAPAYERQREAERRLGLR
jgi:hypothetical protein